MVHLSSPLMGVNYCKQAVCMILNSLFSGNPNHSPLLLKMIGWKAVFRIPHLIMQVSLSTGRSVFYSPLNFSDYAHCILCTVMCTVYTLMLIYEKIPTQICK